MLLSTVGNDFLDGNNPVLGISGRWNDDIGWWALAVITAAEVFGPTAIVYPSHPENQGNTYLSIVENTWAEMLEQWDETYCGGGLYWSRNRNSEVLNQRFYKSSIANGQHVELSARLYALTGNETYRQWADRVYTWMKQTVMTPDYAIYDGVTADDQNDCGSSKLNIAEWSYQLAELISATAILYSKTKTSSYMTESHALFTRLQSRFVSPTTNILYDPNCTPAGSCKSPTGFLWPVYKSLADLHSITPDNKIKSSIATILRASGQSNFESCNSDWNCVRTLAPGTPGMFPNGTNPRDQIETMAILNSLARVNGAVLVSATQSLGVGRSDATGTTAADNSNDNGVSDGVDMKIVIYIGIGAGIVVLVSIVSLVVWFVNKKRREKRELERKINLSDEIYRDSERRGPFGGSSVGVGGSTRRTPENYRMGYRSSPNSSPIPTRHDARRFGNHGRGGHPSQSRDYDRRNDRASPEFG
ncbi:UNVERIFIED_CONTAM: hydrolase 76 protein [Siphonaria sp. JEL0065]|nr:hydrolase 76 protein [Siphonaria sp. JEL0065]